jgi:hypothetical protein
MKLHLAAALLLAPLCACTTGPGGTWATPTGPGATVVAAIETPLLHAFKAPTCLLRTPALLPSTLASWIVPFSNSKEGSGDSYFYNNAAADCGPPYLITSSQVSNEP